MPEELVDITPSPRILQVLGDIEFDHWQCLAELVDNGFDEFLDIKSEGLEWDEFAVTISLPKSDDADPMVEVRDNGRGMGVEESSSGQRWLQGQQSVGEARSLRDGVQHRHRTARGTWRKSSPSVREMRSGEACGSTCGRSASRGSSRLR